MYWRGQLVTSWTLGYWTGIRKRRRWLTFCTPLRPLIRLNLTQSNRRNSINGDWSMLSFLTWNRWKKTHLQPCPLKAHAPGITFVPFISPACLHNREIKSTPVTGAWCRLIDISKKTKQQLVGMYVAWTLCSNCGGSSILIRGSSKVSAEQLA